MAAKYLVEARKSGAIGRIDAAVRRLAERAGVEPAEGDQKPHPSKAQLLALEQIADLCEEVVAVLCQETPAADPEPAKPARAKKSA